MTSRRKIYQKIIEKAKDSIIKAQLQQKEVYNRKHSVHEVFKIGNERFDKKAGGKVVWSIYYYWSTGTRFVLSSRTL